MKKFSFTSIFVVLTLFLLVGCRTTKKVASDGEKAIKIDQCIELQEKAPDRRAWGEGTDYTLSDATAYAQANARANFAYMIESAVEAGTSQSAQRYNKASTDGKHGELVSDRTGLNKNLFSVVTQQIVHNTVVIKTSPYQQKNGQYHVYVCIEYRGTVAEMASEIALRRSVILFVL